MKEKNLYDLLGPNGYKKTRGVYATHDSGYMPIGVSSPEVSVFYRRYTIGSEELQFGCYTPRTYYAIQVWMEVKAALLGESEPEVEWVDFTRAFRTIKYKNIEAARFCARFRELARDMSNSGKITVRLGRQDLSVGDGDPRKSTRTYVAPRELINRHDLHELDAIAPSEAMRFSWKEIEDLFVDLKEFEVAFINGDRNIGKCTSLDKEFLMACANLDVDKMRKCLDAGANVFASDQYGEMAGITLVDAVIFANPEEKVLKLAQLRTAFELVIEYGYDIDMSGYDSPTPLFELPNLGVCKVEIAEFLLGKGADPNALSYIAVEYGAILEVPLSHVWDDQCVYGDEDGTLRQLELMLLRAGAYGLAKARLDWYDYDDLEEYDDEKWAEEVRSATDDMNIPEKYLVMSVQRDHWTYITKAAFDCKDVSSVRDSNGRTILRIFLEDAPCYARNNKRRCREMGEDAFVDTILLLIKGLKISPTADDCKLLYEFCDDNGYTRLRQELDLIFGPTD